MNFPYITANVNEIFAKEKKRWDFIFLRPILVVFYFFLRIVLFPIKFIFHRRPWGFEAWCIDACLTFGLKWFATIDGAELLIRHIQIEPQIYRYLLHDSEHAREEIARGPQKFNGVFGDFDADSLKEIRKNKMTIGHDELSYEIGDHFSKEEFLSNLAAIRRTSPGRHEEMSKRVLDITRKHSFQLLGATNIVIFIVMTITIFGDLRTTVKALNSFDSDSIVLWCMRMLYSDQQDVLNDLEFYLPSPHNRGHYHSSVFFSDPNQYLYYHIAFDEFVYQTLINRPPTVEA